MSSVHGRTIRILDFANAHLNSLGKLELWMQKKNCDANVSSKAFNNPQQRLRRRTTGHVSYKIPVRSRIHGENKQRVATNGHGDRVRRFQRRRANLRRTRCNLAAEKNSESTKHGKYLESHLWMAKRMRMAMCDATGFQVPKENRFGGGRFFSSRASRASVFYERSNTQIVWLTASCTDSIVETMKSCFTISTDGIDWLSQVALSGSIRCSSVLLGPMSSSQPESDSNTLPVVAPVQSLWISAKSTSPALVLWAPAASAKRVLTLLEGKLNEMKSEDVKVVDLSQDYLTTCIRGPLSTQVVADLMSGAEQKSILVNLFDMLKRRMTSSKILPNGSVFAVRGQVGHLTSMRIDEQAGYNGEQEQSTDTIICPLSGEPISLNDFVNHFQSLEVASNVNDAIGLRQEKQSEKPSKQTDAVQSYLCMPDKSIFCDSDIWDQRIMKEYRQQWVMLDSGSVSRNNSKLKDVPVLYIFHQGHSVTTSGWDIVAPAGVGIGPYQCERLSRFGASCGGTKEFEQQLALACEPSFPRDFPDSIEFPAYWQKIEAGWRELMARKPPGKRGVKCHIDENGQLVSDSNPGSKVLGWFSPPISTTKVWRGTKSDLLKFRNSGQNLSGIWVLVTLQLQARQPKGVSCRMRQGATIYLGDNGVGVVTSTSNFDVKQASEPPGRGIGFVKLSLLPAKRCMAKHLSCVIDKAVGSFSIVLPK